MYSARIVQSAWSRWQQVHLDVCVSVFNDDSVYMCDVHACVCVCARALACMRVCVLKQNGGGEYGREGEWGLVCMCVYVSLLCEIKHANGGLF